MEALLTNGRKIYGCREVFNDEEHSQLNVPLQKTRFNVSGGKLAWVPTSPERIALPVATLRERAFVACQMEAAQAEELERTRRAEEVQRQRSELCRLMALVLSESMPESAIEVPQDGTEMMGEVRVTVDGLTFRVYSFYSGVYRLQVLLSCRSCHDQFWRSVSTLGGLGSLLTEEENGTFAEGCPTCLHLKDIEDDPFASE